MVLTFFFFLLPKGHVVPPEKVHADTFKGAGVKYRRVPVHKIAAASHNKPRTAEKV